MNVYFKENAETLFQFKKKRDLDSYMYSKFGVFTDKLCYGIHNLIDTEKWYIGSTLNGIHQRFWRTWDTAHFRLVSEGTHEFLNTENLRNFEVVILYYDEFNCIGWSDLRNIETDFISKYDSYNKGYNKTPIAQAGFYGKKHSEDEKERIRVTLAKTNKNPEVIKRRSDSSKNVWNRPGYRESRANNPKCRGFKCSDDLRKKRSENAKGREAYYSCLAKKKFFLKPGDSDRLNKLLEEFPDLKRGNPPAFVRNDWWNDPKWNDDINKTSTTIETTGDNKSGKE